MAKRLGDYKHVWLLATLIVGQILQPLIAVQSVVARVASASVLIAVSLVVFLRVFESTRERWIGGLLILPAAFVELTHYAFTQSAQLPLAIAYHASLAAFLAFAVSTILVHVFRKRTLAIDDVVGAFSGYMITAIFFGNLYALTWLLSPDAFNIDPHIQWQLNEWHTRRGLFSYFSFATLASVGYGDITTTAPASNTLVWLEVMFGQFYMAVVVATIVGTRLARALGPESHGNP